jgi:CHAT domain-containing protein
LAVEESVEPTAPVQRTASSRRVVVAAASLLALAIAIGGGILFWRGRSPMARMTAAVDSLPHRPIEGRLVALRWAPAPPPPRRGEAATDAATLHLRVVAGEIATGRQVSDPQVGALARILVGKTAEAVQTLEQLARRHPSSAVWSDLAAARLQLARESGEAQLIAAALAAADAAIAADASMPAAAFNRALALEALELRLPAAEAYRAYLRLDGTTEWAAEARERLARNDRKTAAEEWKTAMPRLEAAAARGDAAEVQRVVTQFPQDARRWAEGEYLARWGQATLENKRDEAAQALAVAREVGTALRQRSGEELLSDAVAAIDRAAAANAGQTIAALAGAHADYRRARILYRQRHVGESRPLLASAARTFAAHGSPMELWAAFYEANAATDLNDIAAARAVLDRLLLDRKPSYRALEAEVHWQRGQVLNHLGRFHESLDEQLAALAIFDQLGERESATFMRMNIAGTLSLLGRSNDSWQMRREVFGAAADVGNVSLLERAANAAAKEELSDGHYETAHALFNVAIALPNTTSERLRVDSLVHRAVAAERGGLRLGRNDLTQLKAAAEKIRDASLREEALDDVRFAEAESLARENSALARQMLAASVAFRTERSLLQKLPQAYVALARADREAGRMDDAIANLTRAIDVIEHERAAITRDDLRDTFLGARTAAFDELTAAYVARGDYEKAFDVVERARARTILEKLVRGEASAAVEPLPAGEILRGVPAGTVVAETIRAGEKRLVLTITPAGLRAHELHRGDILAIRDELLAAIERDDAAATDRAAARMYEALIAPIESELAGATTLVVVPDPDLESVPFAALSRRGRHLVEEMAVSVAPSASSFAHLARLSRNGVARPRVFLAGDPAFDRRRVPALPRLPEADREVRAIAEMYPGSEMLTASQASKSRVRSGAAQADVIHIAAHAVLDARDPWLSFVPLAPEPGDAGLLYLHEIARERLPHAPVVVLAGCRTASAVRGSGSLRSLSVAFVAAGSRAVIGSLWDVDDATTRELSVGFHRALRAGRSPAAALREVQLSMLRSSDPALRAARAWSGFQVYGGS